MASSFTAPILPTAARGRGGITAPSLASAPAPAHGRGRGSGGRGSGGRGSGGRSFTAPALASASASAPAPASAPGSGFVFAVPTALPAPPVKDMLKGGPDTPIEKFRKEIISGFAHNYTKDQYRQSLTRCNQDPNEFISLFETLDFYIGSNQIKKTKYLMQGILPCIIFELRLNRGWATAFFLACAGLSARAGSSIFTPPAKAEIDTYTRNQNDFLHYIQNQNPIGRIIDYVRANGAIFQNTTGTEFQLNGVGWVTGNPQALGLAIFNSF